MDDCCYVGALFAAEGLFAVRPDEGLRGGSQQSFIT